MPAKTEVTSTVQWLSQRLMVDTVWGDRLLPRRYVRLAIALAEHVRQQGIHHLHAHFASRAAHVTALASVLAGCPFSFTAHAKDIYHAEVDEDLLRWKISRASFVVTVTDYNRRHLVELCGGIRDAARKIVRVYNGVDLRRFEPGARSHTDRPLLLGVGRLVEKKGFAVLIDACRLLVDRGFRFDCEIIGGGDQEPALRARIAQRDLADVVRLRGTLATEEVALRLRDAHALVAPCVVAADGNIDALPTVILEAMASARPVVSTRLSGIPEMIVHETTGLLADPGSAASLAEAIARLLADPAAAAEMGRAGRRRAETLFDLHANVGILRRLFGQQVSTTPRVMEATGAP